MTVLRPGVPVGVIAGPMLTIGIGFGISLAILDGAAVSSVEPSRAGMAAGVFNTARLTGEAVAIAALGAVLTAVTQARLARTVGSDSAAAATGRLLQGDLTGTLGSARLLAVAGEAYTVAMHTALWLLAGLMVLGAIVIAVLTRRQPSAKTPEVSGAVDTLCSGGKTVGDRASAGTGAG
jgi:hypothetical protein